jgi:hypothetical protein
MRRVRRDRWEAISEWSVSECDEVTKSCECVSGYEPVYISRLISDLVWRVVGRCKCDVLAECVTVAYECISIVPPLRADGPLARCSSLSC